MNNPSNEEILINIVIAQIMNSHKYVLYENTSKKIIWFSFRGYIVNRIRVIQRLLRQRHQRTLTSCFVNETLQICFGKPLHGYVIGGAPLIEQNDPEDAALIVADRCVSTATQSQQRPATSAPHLFFHWLAIEGSQQKIPENFEPAQHLAMAAKEIQ